MRVVPTFDICPDRAYGSSTFQNRQNEGGTLSVIYQVLMTMPRKIQEVEMESHLVYRVEKEGGKTSQFAGVFKKGY